MAVRRDESSDNGHGPRWLKKWMEANEQRAREHEERMREHEERMNANERTLEELKDISRDLAEMNRSSAARLARLEDTVELLKADVAQNRRQTREVVSEISRMDAERRRDRVQQARLFKGMLSTIRRIGR